MTVMHREREGSLAQGTAQAEVVDVPAFIGDCAFGRFHILIMLLCAAALFVDGFDVQAIGFAAPDITREWRLAPGAFGSVFAAGVIGLMVGALIFSPLADRLGRRPILIVSLLFAAVGTLLTALASSVSGLLLVRFLAGLGLGGAMPISIALIAEYSPSALRTRMVVIGFSGYPLGSAFAGFVAATLVPAFGWQSLFYFGCGLAVVGAILLATALPESLKVLTLKGDKPARIAEILNRLDPTAKFGEATKFISHEEKSSGSSVLSLFREGRPPVTILLWILFLVTLLDLFLISHWLPTMIGNAGLAGQTAAIATSFFQIGGLVGSLMFGWLIDKLGVYRVMSAGYVLAAGFIAAIGFASGAAWTLVAVVFGAGFCVVGGQISLNALAARFYPTHMRSTGVGWALGIGRIGSFAGPVIGGIFLARQWSTTEIFLTAAIPALVGAGAIGCLAMLHHRASDAGVAS
jgi:MFS transporter, AAHS family, 4-hydroxybenzoate transporter